MNNSPSTVYYYTHQIAKIVDTSNSTILRWAEHLSEAGYQFERDDANEQMQYRFKEQDVDVLQRFKAYRDQNFSLPACATRVVDDLKNVLSPIAATATEEDNQLTAGNLLDDLVDQKVKERLEPLIAHLKQQFDGVEELKQKFQMLPPPPTHDEMRKIAREEEKLRARITFDVKTKLREAATKLWKDKPEQERTIKVGFFKKIENESAKNEYIRKYISDHFQDHFDNEYQEIANKGRE